MKRIKVAFVINDFLAGGAQKLIADILSRIDRESFEPILITLFDFPERADFFGKVPEGVSLHRLHFKGFKDARSWTELSRTLRDRGPDVVISNLFFSNTILRLLSVLHGYKTITVEHNTYVNKTRMEILIDRILAPLSYRVVAVSETVARFTEKQQRLPEGKIVVVRNGVDVSAIASEAERADRDAARTSICLQSGERLILSIGRMTKQKNQKLLIRSFSLFLKRHPDAPYRLALLGEGTLRSELEELVAQGGIRDKVLMPGVVDPKPYFLSADLLFSTSSIEGLSIAYAEALSYGLPIVATRTAGTDEMIEEGANGYFIEDATEECAVEALEKMVSSDLSAMRAAARHFAEGFSITNTVKEYEDVIRKAATKQHD